MKLEFARNLPLDATLRLYRDKSQIFKYAPEDDFIAEGWLVNGLREAAEIEVNTEKKFTGEVNKLDAHIFSVLLDKRISDEEKYRWIRETVLSVLQNQRFRVGDLYVDRESGVRREVQQVCFWNGFIFGVDSAKSLDDWRPQMWGSVEAAGPKAALVMRYFPTFDQRCNLELVATESIELPGIGQYEPFDGGDDCGGTDLSGW